MNVLFTVNTYYPLKDGVQFVTGYLAEGLVKLGHDVTVITPKGECNILNEKHNGVTIYRVDVYNKHTIYYGEKGKYVNLVKKISNNTDVMINVCTQNPMTDLLFPIIDQLKCKKILYMHGMFDAKWHRSDFRSISEFGHKIWNNLRWKKYYKDYRNIFYKYDEIVQLHEFDTANVFFKKNFSIQCKVIHNAALDDFFELEEKDNYAILVANYMERKNQEFVLRAYYQAKTSNDFGLILIGSSPNEYFKKIINLNDQLENEYGKKNVKILYGISRKETINYIKKAKMYLMGSKWEAFPISLVEAMAAGIPFISTDVGIVKYLPGGIIVKNEEDMAYWISMLLAQVEVAKHLGKTGYSYAKHTFTIDHAVKELESIIKDFKYEE